MVLCTRNRMYAFKYLEAISAGNDPENIDIEFVMDQFDVELGKLLKGEK